MSQSGLESFIAVVLCRNRCETSRGRTYLSTDICLRYFRFSSRTFNRDVTVLCAEPVICCGSMAKKILIVEDEYDLVKLLKYSFEKEGFKVNSATDGSVALAEMRRDEPDLVVLDLMLPGMDGLEICRWMRRQDKFAGTPILMLTARAEEADRIVGLELGADDYVTKPFSVREVVARVRALLRRREPIPQAAMLQRGDLLIDPSAHSVSVAGRQVELSAHEFRLLHFMASHPGMVFSRNQVLDRVWGNDRTVTPRSVDVYVRRVREKVEREPVHGVGYRFAGGSD